MTTVHISLGRDDGTDQTAAKGVVEWEPTTRREDGTMVILERGFTVPLVDGEATVIVDPSGLTWCWRVTERTDSGGTVRSVSVPDSADVVEYVDLPDVDPTTLAPTADPEAAWWTMAGNTVTSGAVVGGDLILTRYDETTVNAGNVRGPQGATGATGPKGDTGPTGPAGGVTSVDGAVGGVVLSSTYVAPTGTDGRLQVAGVDVTPAQVGAAPALGADDNYVTGAEKSALHTHPAVIAQGATQADARAAIGAGTSSLVLGIGPTNAAPAVAPVLSAAVPAPSLGANMAPALSAWTPAGGASWSDPTMTVPAGGSISTPLTVVSGTVYQITLTDSATSGELTVTLGTVTVTYPASATAVTVVASGSGVRTLTLGGTTWAALVTGVTVQAATLATPVMTAGAGEVRAHSSNNAMGGSAQRSLTTGNYNNAMGQAAQRSLTTGNSNNAMGGTAQYSLTTGNSNNAMGYYAQYSLTTGSFNNAMGQAAQRFLTTGNSNNAMGYYAQYSLTTGSFNNAMGGYAQYSLTTGSFNNAMGQAAQLSLTTGNSNNAMGQYAQRFLTTGSFNNAMGHDAQRSLTTGSFNNAMGYYAQLSLTTGNYNNAMGHYAQYAPAGVAANATTTASRQTSVGHETGQSSAVQADDLTTIGYRAIGTTQSTALGSGATAGHVGSVALGYGTQTTATGQVAVGARDVEVQDASKGLVLKSPDGSRWRATISDAGVPAWTKL